MKTSKIILALFIMQISCLLIPQTIFCQTETLDGITFTPPQGWTKTQKEGAVVYATMDKITNAFCILTVYASTPSVGNPGQDFANEWNNLVVKPFKAPTNPKTETQPAPEGWQATGGGAEIEISEGVKSVALLTVFSGFGKAVSVLAIFNDQSHLAQMQSFIDGIKLDKTRGSVTPTQVIQNGNAQRDPFPDRPGYDPQQPLSGALKESIAMADLAGTWDNGGAGVQSYVYSGSGNYAATTTTLVGEQHLIHANGSFEYKATASISNQTVRETDSGSVILSGDNIIFKFKGRSSQRYQIIAFMTQPNGSAIFTLVGFGENEKQFDAARMKILCDHAHGYIQCQGGEVWSRAATNPAK